MESNREQRIRQRAYEIWEREGRPHGRDAEHWQQAAAEIDAETVPAGAEAPSRQQTGPSPAPPEASQPRRSRAVPRRGDTDKRR